MAGSIREASQQAYAEALAGIVERVVTEGGPTDGIREKLASGCLDAARIYPFDRLHFEPVELDGLKEHGEIEFPGGTQWRVSFSPNENFEVQIPFGLLDRDLVRRRLKDRLAFSREVSVTAQLGAVDAMSHQAYNALQGINSKVLCEVLGRGAPPEALRVNIEPVEGESFDSLGGEDPGEFLLQQLSSIFYAEQSTRMVLAVGQMIANRGVIRWKFCGEEPFRLVEVIQQAGVMFKALQQRDPENVAPLTQVIHHRLSQ